MYRRAFLKSIGAIALLPFLPTVKETSIFTAGDFPGIRIGDIISIFNTIKYDCYEVIKIVNSGTLTLVKL